MRFSIISLFPDFFSSPLQTSMLKRAIDKGVIEVDFVNIRDFGEGKHKIVDDKPFGGEPGMLMKVGPIMEAVESVKKKESHVIYLTPQGDKLNSKNCEKLAKKYSHIILICGHYEGIDQRVVDLIVDEEISIGDYVLTSGMIPALVLLDSITRFIEGAIGNEKSVSSDTFYNEEQLKGPQYTRPATFRGLGVPNVLLSGDHKQKDLWRKKIGRKKTIERQIKTTRMA